MGASERSSPEANAEKGMNESLVRSPSTRTVAAHTAMRMSQRRASVEVVDGAAWIVKDRRIHKVTAHSATLRRTGMSRSEAAVVTLGAQGIVRSVPR